MYSSMNLFENFQNSVFTKQVLATDSSSETCLKPSNSRRHVSELFPLLVNLQAWPLLC